MLYIKMLPSNIIELAKINKELVVIAQSLYPLSLDNKEIGKNIDDILSLSDKISLIVRTTMDINK